MNQLEFFVHNALEHTPALKNIVRDAYQFIFFWLPVKSECHLPIRMFRNSFFGFHDKCPWSADNLKILSHKFPSSIENKKFGLDPIRVGYYDLQNHKEEFVAVGTTKAWNWQQGSMLQWVGDSDLILYNDYGDGKNISKIVDGRGRLLHQMDRPIGAISRDGKHGLSYSFERLRIGAPGYEYKYGTAQGEKDSFPDGDGLYLIDVHSARSKRLFSLADIIRVEPQPGFDNSYHFFSHCLFSPLSKRFLFYHRWREPLGYLASRLITSDLNGKNIWVAPVSDMISHVAWLDETHIIGYLRSEKFGDKYHIIEDGKGINSVITSNEFSSDGHPQVDVRSRYMVTDTYPDRYRLQKLYVYDFNLDRAVRLLSLKIPFRYRNSCRCDFHPRWNRLGTEISFDSAHSGMRSQCIMPVSNLLMGHA